MGRGNFACRRTRASPRVREPRPGQPPCSMAGFDVVISPPARATRTNRHAPSRCTETGGPRGVCGLSRAIASRASCAPRTDDRSASSLARCPPDHRRPARNREYRTPRVGRSHFGGGASGSRSVFPTYPQRPHKYDQPRQRPTFPVHPHMLRHGCGYALANAGYDTHRSKAWLRHKNIQHTVRCTELAPDRFKGFWP
jgi:hypothetical protein